MAGVTGKLASWKKKGGVQVAQVRVPTKAAREHAR
jgi:hypothetical protein